MALWQLLECTEDLGNLRWGAQPAVRKGVPGHRAGAFWPRRSFWSICWFARMRKPLGLRGLEVDRVQVNSKV